MIKRFIAFSLALLNLFIFSACSKQKEELINMAKVMLMGVDKDPDGKYRLSIQVLRQGSGESGGKMGGGGGGSENETADYSASGETIRDCFYNLNKELGKTIRFSHSKAIIIGEAAAANGISEIIDFSLRSQEFSPSIPVLVAKGKALDILQITTPEDPLPASALEGILRRQYDLGLGSLVSDLKIANALLSSTIAPIAGVVKASTKDPIQNKVSYDVEGTAVFDEDKLIGYLDDKQTRGYWWIKGSVTEGSVIIPLPQKGKISTKVLSSKSKIKPVMKNGKLSGIEVIVKAKSDMREVVDNIDPIKDPSIMGQLDELQNAVIKKEIESALSKAQNEFHEDIYGFGEEVHKKYPKEWKKIEQDWKDKFPQINIEVTVQSSIKRLGTISKPIH